jgi:hypothetical protein
MGLIRSHGCRSLLVYCVSPWCNDGATLNADWLPDDTMVLDLPRPNGRKLQACFFAHETDGRHPPWLLLRARAERPCS